MKKNFSAKKFISVTVAAAMAFSLAACGSSSSGSSTATTAAAAETKAAETEAAAAADSAASEDTPVTLRLASVVSTTELEARNSGMSAGLMTWVDTVEAESGGSISIELFPDGQLASGTDAIVNGIQTGAFEVAHFTTGNWASYTDAFSELNVPYLYSNYEDVHSILEGEIGESMKNQLEQDVSGIKALAYISIGFRNVTASKPIESVEDMKGLKIRTMDDKLQIAAMEAMGAAVTSVPITELYSALQTKMVDAQENPLSTIYAQKFYEVNPYCCLTNHSYTSTFVFMNADIYNGLSDNQKAAIEKANEAATAASKEAAEKADEEFEALLEENGMTVYHPTDEQVAGFKEAASSCWGQAKDIMGEDRYNALMSALGM
ncbi:MAG: TRAP transporter substrate-binding protein [Clostridiales bacterium]|nr:TRAP transporter substrate-binding protein [Clostridiales bacterium]